MNSPVAETAAFLPPGQLITTVLINTGNNIMLSFGAQPGFLYHVEMATNLAPPAWSPVSGSTTNAVSNSVTFTDTNPLTHTQRFYRTASP